MTERHYHAPQATQGDPGFDLGRLALCLAESAAASVDAPAAIRNIGQLLTATPLRTDRLFVSAQPLHPAFRARTYLWLAADDRVRVVEWPHGLENRPGYLASPDHHVHTTRTGLRVPNLQNAQPSACALYGQLRAAGFTDYLIVPLSFGDGTVNTLSITTRQPGGFPEKALEEFHRLTGLLTVILERLVALENTDTALRTYLGRHAGGQVLRGEIRAGHGRLVEAVVLFADLRDFTSRAATLEPSETVRLLNDYFDCLVAPIEQHGGHVLKFIGDAVLAFFPAGVAGAPEPQPLDAVAAIRHRLNALNRARAEKDEPPLRHGLCLHFGKVLYGNIGSSERLDFTIIGDAVNVAARCLEETRALGIDYLATDAFVSRFAPAGSSPLGARRLKGIAEPVKLHALVTESK
jgi:adenylate cyclase